jgi:hypothetical protein
MTMSPRLVRSRSASSSMAVGLTVGWSSKGAVTRTEFGRAKIGKASSDSGHGGGSPRLERFFSEDAVRVAGGEMALDVEGVLDGGVNR